MGFPHGLDSKESAMQETGFDSWIGKVPWRRESLSIPEFLTGEFHEQRSLVIYTPWGHRESNTIEWLTLSFHIIIFISYMCAGNISIFQ